MENISNQLGRMIRQYRKQKGLTQETLALNSGLNVSFLGDIERGIKKPSVESLEKLLAALGVTFQEFFNIETSIEAYRVCPALDRLYTELQGRSDCEVEMIYNIVKRILEFKDKDSAMIGT